MATNLLSNPESLGNTINKHNDFEIHNRRF